MDYIGCAWVYSTCVIPCMAYERMLWKQNSEFREHSCMLYVGLLKYRYIPTYSYSQPFMSVGSCMQHLDFLGIHHNMSYTSLRMKPNCSIVCMSSKNTWEVNSSGTKPKRVLGSLAYHLLHDSSICVVHVVQHFLLDNAAKHSSPLATALSCQWWRDMEECPSYMTPVPKGSC